MLSQLSEVTVATITRARDEREEAVLRAALQRLGESGLHVAVADADSGPGFRTFLESLRGFSVATPRESGLIAQVKASLDLAAHRGTAFILYTEPDKEHFFGRPLQEFLRRAAAPDVGVALASRSAASFSTFPPMQRYTEGVVNDLCADRLGQPGDYSYGPFLMNRALCSVVADFPADLGWGWRPALFLAARRRGMCVSHVVGDYPCPTDQRHEDDDDRIHRMWQLGQNIAGLIT